MEQSYTLQITHRELVQIATALGQQPYAAVAPLIANIDAQIKAQAQAAHDGAADAAARPSGAPVPPEQ